MIRTKSQNSRLYGLFSKLNISKDNKEILVEQFTNGRTCKSSEMLFNECNNLIETLAEQHRSAKSQKSAIRQYVSDEQVLRRNIFKLMYDIGFIDNQMDNKRKIYIINGWIKKKMNSEKELNKLNIQELNKMITQLQTVRRIYAERAAKQATWN